MKADAHLQSTFPSYPRTLGMHTRFTMPLGEYIVETLDERERALPRLQTSFIHSGNEVRRVLKKSELLSSALLLPTLVLQDGFIGTIFGDELVPCVEQVSAR